MPTFGCLHGSRAPDELTDIIHHNQAGHGRHRCAVCAYAAGLLGKVGQVPADSERCERNAAAPASLLLSLPESQAGPARHGCVVCAYSYGLRRRTEQDPSQHEFFPDEAHSLVGIEGAVRSVVVSTYERDPALRAACLDHHGSRCRVCRISFEETYGDIGRGFIHVHHLRPLSEVGVEHQVSAVDDLVPVCPNCHSMMHQRTPPFTPEELIERLR